jgi:hypothetical protein
MHSNTSPAATTVSDLFAVAKYSFWHFSSVWTAEIPQVPQSVFLSQDWDLDITVICMGHIVNIFNMNTKHCVILK